MNFKELMHKESRFYSLFAYLILVIGTLLYLFIDNMSFPYYDSWYYWHIADPIKTPDGYDLYAFPNTFRGCIYPILLFFSRVVSLNLFDNEFWIFRIVISMCVPFLFVYELPTIFNKKIKSLSELIRIVVVYIVFAFIFSDFIKYPLSDIFALFFLCTAFYCYNLELKHKSIVKSIIKGFCVGCFFYLAYNTRVAFIMAIGLSVVIYLFFAFKKKLFDYLLIISVFVGASITSLPQILINHHYTEVYSPRVLTENHNPHQKLEMLQLFWGLRVDMYETYVGKDQQWPEPGVNFIDRAGHEIIEREHFDKDHFTLAEYFSLYIKYPLDMIGIMSKHLVAYMTPKYYDLGYVYNLKNDRTFLFLFSIMIWFVGGGYAVYAISKGNINIRNTLYLLLLALPFLAQVPGAPEIRFFLGIYVLCYFFVFYYNSYSNRSFLTWLKKNWIGLIVTFCIILMLWLGLMSELLANDRAVPFLINDHI